MSEREEKISRLINQYNSLQLNYTKYIKYMYSKIENLLMENNIKYQSITYRVKENESLKKKLMKENTILSHLNDIRELNDLSGMRIIIYDRSEVNKIKEILEKNFDVKYYTCPKENYDASNITIALKENKINYFEKFRCEVQIVVILSHALLEFGHNIFYKDVEDLEQKDAIEYKKLKSAYEDAFKEAIQIETKMKLIKERVEEIKIGYNSLSKILDNTYIIKIKNIKDCAEINNIFDDLENCINIVNNTEGAFKLIKNNRIIEEVVETFVKLENANYNEDINYFYFGTFLYTYDRLLKILGQYVYLWKDSFSFIVNILGKYVEEKNNNSKLFKELKEMIVNSMNMDAIKNRFILYKDIYNWIITNPEILTKLKLEVAIKYCDSNLQYSEECDFKKMQFYNKIIKPGEEYEENIKEVLKVFCNLCIQNEDTYILNKLRCMASPIIYNDSGKEIVDNFKLNYILKIFESNFEKLDVYVKGQIYELIRVYDEENYQKTDFFKKIKNDESYLLYSNLFSNYLIDSETTNYSENELSRDKYFHNYLNILNHTKEYEIIQICKIMDKYEKELKSNYFRASKFLYDIGFKYGNSINVYENTNNVYILLGIYNSDKNYKIKIEEKDIYIILKYLILNDEIFSIKLFNQILENYQIGNNINNDKMICSIIFKNQNFFKCKNYKDIAMSIIRYYNIHKKPIIGEIYIINDKKEFVQNMNKKEMSSILINASYSEYTHDMERLVQKCFEKYPDIIRKYYKKMIANKNEFIDPVNYYPIYESENFKSELDKNIEFCLNLLEDFECYKITLPVQSMLGKYNSEVYEKLKKYIDKKEYLLEILKLLRILKVSINDWNIFEEILEKEINEQIESEIHSMLFDTVASGENGLSKAFKEKYNFLKKKKGESKNENVKKFLEREIEIFKNLYNIEENENNIRKIENLERYKFNKKMNGEG